MDAGNPFMSRDYKAVQITRQNSIRLPNLSAVLRRFQRALRPAMRPALRFLS